MSELKLHVLDVGQGASAVLHFGGNLYGIVDCGGSKSGEHAAIVDFMVQAISEQPDTRILFLLVTHLDADHIRAISGLMSNDDIRERIEKLYCNQLAYRRLLQAVKKSIKAGSGIASNRSNRSVLSSLDYLGNLVEHHKQKQDFLLGCISPQAGNLEDYPVKFKVPGVPSDIEIEMWAPSEELLYLASEAMKPEKELLAAIFSGREIEDWNAASIVMTISVNGRRVLLPGDANKETWTQILSRGKENWNGADIAVAWHHGARLGQESGRSYDSYVWQKVLSKDSKVVCISCGSQNRYGHPHPDTIAAIASCGGKVYCTERAAFKGMQEPLPKDDVALELAKKSKSMWVEDDRKCCGDIVVTIDPAGNVDVKCPKEQHPCCTDSVSGSTLVSIES